MKFKNILRMLMVTMLSATMIGCSNDKKDVVVNNDEDVVVATSVAVTEILDALGVKVSGVPTTSYELPESTKEAVEVGNPMSPDLEIIKSLNPSVVVSVDTLGADYKKLFTDNNIPSEFVSLSSLEGLKETVSNLGNKFNKQAEAEAILKELNTKEEEMASISEKEKTNILILFAAPGSTMIATEKSYIGNLVKIVGGKNIIEDASSAYVTYSKEEIAKLNPDKILV
ncbi:MAG: ABC transporter substrate-binding protein, partial [Clostridium sp.]